MTGRGNEKEIADEVINEIKTQALPEKKKVVKLAIKKQKIVVQEKPLEQIKVKAEKEIAHLNTIGVLDKKLSIIQIPDKPAKKAIRRSALDIKKAEAVEEDKRLAQEQEWEIPAFLRRVKLNK